MYVIDLGFLMDNLKVLIKISNVCHRHKKTELGREKTENNFLLSTKFPVLIHSVNYLFLTIG
jgi:hypothetical protein